MADDFIFCNDIVLCRKVHSTTPQEKIIVSLSNGETVFEDRLEKTDEFKDKPIFWKRLKKYVESNKEGVKIAKVRFQSNNGMYETGKDAKAYYFIKRQFGDLGFSMMETFRLGYSNDLLFIEGIEVGYGKISNFRIDFNKGGFGVIRNYR